MNECGIVGLWDSAFVADDCGCGWQRVSVPTFPDYQITRLHVPDYQIPRFPHYEDLSSSSHHNNVNVGMWDCG